VGCRNRLFSVGRVRSKVVIVGARNNEMDGTKSQPMLHPTARSRGQNSPRCDSIARIWMVSADTRTTGGLNMITGDLPGILKMITRAVYFLNRSHSSRERFLDRD
jgi:hypothetical protein